MKPEVLANNPKIVKKKKTMCNGRLVIKYKCKVWLKYFEN